MTDSSSDSSQIGSEMTRFAQLIYTSFDDGSSSGGWQIKAETGALTSEERHLLTSRIVTRFEAGKQLPAFPTQEEILGRPARLAYATLSADGAGFWHTIDAGNDGTGRPGNVFAHVLLDRDRSTPSPLRPIELWGSAGWLRPYGARDVAIATLTDGNPPKPNPAIGISFILQFLLDRNVDRQSVFRVLLDAVYASLNGGPGVLFISQNISDGPKWIAAVSYFMSPGTSRSFSWCTYDDPSLAIADLRRGTNLVVAGPDARQKGNDIPGVVIDETEEPGIGEIGSVHRTAMGSIAVTGWSILAEGVLEDEETARRIIEGQDAIAAAVGDFGLSPSWPLAVAVRSDERLHEYHGDANQVIAKDRPADSSKSDWIASLISQAVSETAPDNADEALSQLLHSYTRGVGVEIASRRMLQMALTEKEWIGSGALNAVPAVRILDVEPLLPLLDTALAFVREVDADPISGRVLHLAARMYELLVRLGRPGIYLERALSLVRAIVDEAVEGFSTLTPVDPLVSDDAIGGETREYALRAALARLDAPGLRRIDIKTWAWLFGDDHPDPTVPEEPTASDRPLLAHYIRSALEDARWVRRGDSAERLAAQGAFLALDSEQLSDTDCRELINAIAQASRISSLDLEAMFAQHPSRIAPGAAADSLFYDVAPAGLIVHLAARTEDVNDTAADRAAMVAARLRALCSEPQPWKAEKLSRGLVDAQIVIQEHFSVERFDSAATDLLDVLTVLCVVGQARGLKWAHEHGTATQLLRKHMNGREEVVTDAVVELTVDESLDVGWFAAHSFLHSINDLPPAELLIDGEYQDGCIADAVVSNLVSRQRYRGPSDSGALLDCAWNYVKTLTAVDAQIFFEAFPRAARDWLHDAHIAVGSARRLGFLKPNF